MSSWNVIEPTGEDASSSDEGQIDKYLGQGEAELRPTALERKRKSSSGKIDHVRSGKSRRVHSQAGPVVAKPEPPPSPVVSRSLASGSRHPPTSTTALAHKRPKHGVPARASVVEKTTKSKKPAVNADSDSDEIQIIDELPSASAKSGSSKNNAFKSGHRFSIGNLPSGTKSIKDNGRRKTLGSGSRDDAIEILSDEDVPSGPVPPKVATSPSASLGTRKFKSVVIDEKDGIEMNVPLTSEDEPASDSSGVGQVNRGTALSKPTKHPIPTHRPKPASLSEKLAHNPPRLPGTFSAMAKSPSRVKPISKLASQVEAMDLGASSTPTTSNHHQPSIPVADFSSRQQALAPGIKPSRINPTSKASTSHSTTATRQENSVSAKPSTTLLDRLVALSKSQKGGSSSRHNLETKGKGPAVVPSAKQLGPTPVASRLPLFHEDSPPTDDAMEVETEGLHSAPITQAQTADEVMQTPSPSPELMSADGRRRSSVNFGQGAVPGSGSSKTASPGKKSAKRQTARKHVGALPTATASSQVIATKQQRTTDVRAETMSSMARGLGGAGPSSTRLTKTKTTTTKTVETTFVELETREPPARTPSANITEGLDDGPSSSRGSTSSILRPPPSPQKAFVSHTEIQSNRRVSTVAARSSEISTPGLHAITKTASRSINSSSRTQVIRQRAVITSLQDQVLQLGGEWLNPFDDKACPATPIVNSLQDSMNNQSKEWLNDPHRKTIFEAVIREESRDEAPIQIINEIDDEPCPPFEFAWTNSMYYGEGVPRIDLDVKGCACEGPCDPTSRLCACVVRQEFYANGLGEGFAYNEDGQYRQYTHVPVFECNDACGCTEDCQNRVVQKGRQFKLAIKKTKYKGWGVFALQAIPFGSFIGVYSGELLTEDAAQHRGLMYNQLGRTYLFNLDFNHLRVGEFYGVEQVPHTPSTKEWKSKYCVDAFHAGNHTRFFNHSCDPNLELYPVYTNDADVHKPLLCAFTRRDVQKGDELCFSYHNEEEDEENARKKSPSKSRAKKKASHPDEDDLVFCPCKCGSAKCTGTMFSREEVSSEEGDSAEDSS